MISKKDKKITKLNSYKHKLSGMKKYANKKYTENLVVLKRHYRANTEPLIHNAHEPQYNFLKYWRIVKKWAIVKYDLSTSDLELLLFLYDEGIWKLKDFMEATEIHSWDTGRLKRFIDGVVFLLKI